MYHSMQQQQQLHCMHNASGQASVAVAALSLDFMIQ
jgi:hypothetical protein